MAQIACCVQRNNIHNGTIIVRYNLFRSTWFYIVNSNDRRALRCSRVVHDAALVACCSSFGGVAFSGGHYVGHWRSTCVLEVAGGRPPESTPKKPPGLKRAPKRPTERPTVKHPKFVTLEVECTLEKQLSPKAIVQYFLYLGY